MDRNARAVLQQALALSAEERADIAGTLLQSIEPPADAGVDRAWRQEVAERVAARDAGEVETVPWETVRDRLYARLREQRTG